MLELNALIRNKIFKIRRRIAQARLARIKRDQLRVFIKLRKKFSSYFDAVKNYNFSQFTTPFWENTHKELERAVFPYPSFSFLRNPIISSTMVNPYGGKLLEDQLKFLELLFSKKQLKRILQEEYVGNPLLFDFKYLTSHNSVDHLYHLCRFCYRTKCKLNKIKTIVEWGGGYGNMAKIYTRLRPRPVTYIIIDIPLVSCIQWLYLSTIFGEENVNLLLEPQDRISNEKFNLIPVYLLDSQKINADLFISTFALSESSKFSQNYIVNQNWFNSKHFLLAYHTSNEVFLHAERVGKLFSELDVIIEDMIHRPQNYYLFF